MTHAQVNAHAIPSLTPVNLSKPFALFALAGGSLIEGVILRGQGDEVGYRATRLFCKALDRLIVHSFVRCHFCTSRDTLEARETLHKAPAPRREASVRCHARRCHFYSALYGWRARRSAYNALP